MSYDLALQFNTHVVRAIVDVNDIPSLSFELPRSVLGKTVVDSAVYRDSIVVVYQNQIIQSQMPCQRNCCRTLAPELGHIPPRKTYPPGQHLLVNSRHR